MILDQANSFFSELHLDGFPQPDEEPVTPFHQDPEDLWMNAPTIDL